jgi:hypothetical protein
MNNELSEKEIKEIKDFSAKVNNYLMSLPVSGDNIFASAELMLEASRIFKRLNDE